MSSCVFSFLDRLFHLYKMNFTSQHTTFNLIIDCSILIFSSIGFCSSLFIFMFICHYIIIKRRNSSNRVALLLTANVYLSIILNSIFYLEQFVRIFRFHWHSIEFLRDQTDCQLRAYFQFVAYCGVFYSNTLQSIYRLCRIVYHTRASLQSFKLYRILVLIQWIICCLLSLLISRLGYFPFQIDHQICFYDLSNFGQVVLIGFLAYVIPMNITIGCYYYTLRQVRLNSTNLRSTMTRIQLANARRDLLIHFRICVLLGLLLVSMTPAMISVNMYLIARYLAWWSYEIHWLSFILTMSIVSLVLLLISPHVKNLWRQNRVDIMRTLMNPNTMGTNQ